MKSYAPLPSAYFLRDWSILATIFLVTIGASVPASAKDGITVESIQLVQIADTSGSRRSLTAEVNAGTLVYFAHINSTGGIYGRHINVKTIDDGYVVEQTLRAAETLIRNDDAFAVISTIGTANTEKILPKLSHAKIPLLAPLTGATSLRVPFNRYVFHVRAGYAREVESMVEHVHTLGVRRVAVFYDDDAFGQDVLRSVEDALARRQLKPVSVGKVEPGSSDVTAATQSILESNPEVVICGSFGKSLVEFVKTVKHGQRGIQLYALSFFTAGTSIKQLGVNARGIAVTQVMPTPSGASMPLLHEFKSLMEKHASKEPISPISLEGFVTAKVIVEGLRRAGPGLTREKFIDSLDGFRSFDLGGLYLSYSPTDHSGLKRTDITLVNGDGQLLK